MGSTYHIVGNKFQVAAINLDLVHSKDPTHFLENSFPGHLHPIGLQDGVYVIGVNIIIFNDAFVRVGSEFPYAAEVGAVGCELQALSESDA